MIVCAQPCVPRSHQPCAHHASLIEETSRKKGKRRCSTLSAVLLSLFTHPWLGPWGLHVMRMQLAPDPSIDGDTRCYHLGVETDLPRLRPRVFALRQTRQYSDQRASMHGVQRMLACFVPDTVESVGGRHVAYTFDAPKVNNSIDADTGGYTPLYLARPRARQQRQSGTTLPRCKQLRTLTSMAASLRRLLGSST